MLGLKAISVFMACWYLHHSSGQQMPIAWSYSQNSQFSVSRSEYTVEGILTESGAIYGQGQTNNNPTKSGGMVGNNFCFRGSANRAKGKWKVKGTIGLKSLTVEGTYITTTKTLDQSNFQESGSASIGNVKIGKTTSAPAICGFVTKMYSNMSGFFSDTMDIQATNNIYNDVTKKGERYEVRISKQPPGSASQPSSISVSTSNPSQPSMKHGCINTYTTNPPNSWTAEGYIDKATFSASGFYADQFWMLTNLSRSPSPVLFAGTYTSNGMCARSGECRYEIRQTSNPHGGGGGLPMTGKADPAASTWEMNIPIGNMAYTSQAALANHVLKGTFTDDGTFKGNGDAAGFLFSVNGKWGMGCFYTTSGKVSCSNNPIAGLTAENSHGCGTASRGSGPFSGSGTYKGTQWNVTGLIAQERMGGGGPGYTMLQINGTVTYNGKSLTFQASGNPVNGIQIQLVLPTGKYHTVEARQIDTTWVAVGKTV